MENLIVQAHDGTFDGDNTFYVDVFFTVPHVKGMDLAGLKSALRKKWASNKSPVKRRTKCWGK